MYDSYYLNFTSQISRDLLEELAQAVHQTGSHTKIAKVPVYSLYLVIFIIFLLISRFTINI